MLFLFFSFVVAFGSVDISGFTLVNLEKTMSKATIKINKQEKFVLKIESNPTTGYDWELANLSQIKSDNVISFLNTKINGEYEEDPHERPMTGVGGKTFLKFQAVNSGKATIKIQYKRSWETEILYSIEVEATVQ